MLDASLCRMRETRLRETGTRETGMRKTGTDRMKRLCHVLAVALLLAILLPPSLTTPAQANMLTWIREAAPTTLDPHATRDPTTLAFLRQIYEPLVQRDTRAKLSPGLARSWRRDGDGLTWRFQLRVGTTFHDGSPLMAADVAFSLNRARAVGGAFASLLRSIETVAARGQYVVEITTSQPDRRLPLRLSQIGIMNSAWSRTEGLDDRWLPGDRRKAFGKANGTGPFQLRSVSDDLSDGAVLDVADGWWASTKRPDLPFESIQYLAIANPEQRVSAFKRRSEKLAFLQDVPISLGADDASDTSFSLTDMPSAAVVYLGINAAPKDERSDQSGDALPLGMPGVRQAIVSAIDRRKLVERALRGRALATGTLVTPQSDAYPRGQDRVAARSKRMASKLLREAGFANGFKTTLHCPASGIANIKAVCASVAKDLKSVGIDVTTIFSSPRDHADAIQRGDTQIFVARWTDASLSGDDVIENVVAPTTYRRTEAGAEELRSLIARRKSETSAERRIEEFAELSKRVADDGTLLPLFIPTTAYATSGALTIVPDIFDAPFLAAAALTGRSADGAEPVTATGNEQAQ
ncbi:MAG: ABC transporter substrate-binding protein [Pseudomonadota bacterium]